MPPLIKVGASYNYKKGQADAMQLDKFLTRVLPSRGAYYLIKGDNANRFSHTEYSTTADVATNAGNLAQHRNNIFYSTGSFKPGASREGKDVVYKKSFYLDLDCGPGKDFTSKAEALKKYKKFQKAAGILPPNIIVDSGNGLHLYWALTQPIPADKWFKIAELLKRVCDDLDFPADKAITSDRARILRAPDTTNNKSANNPKPCRVIHSKDKDYSPASFITSIKHWADKKTEVPSALAGLAITDDLSAGISEGYRGPKYFAFGKDECLVMQDMLATGGEHYSEAAWMHAIGLLTFCEDGHDFIHDISGGHTTYSESETEMKWRVRLRGRQAEKFGPTLCKTLDRICDGDLCSACPHNGRIKTPLVLCRPPHADIELPRGYSQGEGGIFFTPNDPEAVPIFIHGENITKLKLYRSTSLAGDVTTQLLFDIGERKDIQLNTNILSRYGEVHAALANQQVFVNLPPRNPMYNLVMMMNSWIQELNKSKDIVQANPNFGWQRSGKKHGFTVGGTTSWDDGTTTPTLSTDHVMVGMYTPTGELKEWKKAANYVIAQDRQAINCAIASAFAAPLVCFTGVRGVFMSIVSKESGVGKSMALNIAAGVWGNPHSSVSQMDDTHNSMMQKMGTLNHLPGYWDEIRMLANNASFAKSLFGVSIGKVKGRLNADATRKAEPLFQTMAVAASNESLIAHVDNSIESSDAGRMRVMEFSGIKPVPALSKHEGAILAGKVDNNYGQAGAVYAEYLVNNHDKVDARVQDTMQKLYKKLDAAQEERFWVSLLATTLVGAGIANSLGLTKFDMKAMQEFLIAEFKKHHASANTHFRVGAVTAPDVVTDFVNSNSNHGLTYTDIDDIGKPAGEPIDDLTVSSDARMPIMFEYGKVSGTYKIVKSMFTQWLSEQKKNPASVMSELRDEATYFHIQRCKVGEAVSGTRGCRVPCILIRV